MADRKPLIGITGPRSGSLGPRTCIALGLYLSGAIPVQLRPGDAPPVRKLSGVVISGGHDIEPVLYKRPAEVEGNYDPERDSFESEIIDQALGCDRPLLGICRGAQLLNVTLGGTLFQNLKVRLPDARRRRSILPVSNVTLEHASQLAEELGKTSLLVNRLHNQAIDTVGVGLNVSARDSNDVVQAVESPERDFVVGVQWHPEFLLYQATSIRLFAALVRAARTHDSSTASRS